MPDLTLLDVVRSRFGVSIDPESNGGQVLRRLTPTPPFDDADLSGLAVMSAVALTSNPYGLSVRGAAGGGVVWQVPAGSVEFTLVPPGADGASRTEIHLTPLSVPLPGLMGASLEADGGLRPAGQDVRLDLPGLLLVVEAGTAAPATVRFAQASEQAGGLEVTMDHDWALIDSGGALGFGFDRAQLDVSVPGALRLRVPEAKALLDVPALRWRVNGTGRDLVLSLEAGALSGEFALAPAWTDGVGPAFLDGVAGTLRMERGRVALLELTGEIDATRQLQTLVGRLPNPGAPMRFVLGLAPADGWATSLVVRPGGGGGALWRTDREPGQGDAVLDTLGAFALLGPLLAASPPGSGDAFVPLALATSAAGGVAAAEALTTRAVVLHGADLVIRSSGGDAEAYVVFDVEVEVDVAIELDAVELIRTTKPVRVRHQSLGVRVDLAAGSEGLGLVFDPARGFTLDLSDPGLFAVPGGLGSLLQPEAARVARDNLVFLEVDLVLGADLGVVKVDRATVRAPLGSDGHPSLTALGVRVDVPGALSGGGYLALLSGGGFTGSIDAAIAPPLGVRVAGGLSVRPAGDRTGVLLTLAADLPVPLPLANSGLGLFGFAGLFAMHFRRDQAPGGTALAWFRDKALGDATRIEAWTSEADRWAFGLGAVLGTVEGGFLFHAKGMVVVELPGPGVLMVMDADLLSARPTVSGTETGTYLAVIDVRPESVTIGIVVDYDHLAPLISLIVPAEAHFDLRRLENWHLDVGGIPPGAVPASVQFLDEFRAEGYLLIHGDGVPDFPPGPLRGFSVAAGVRAAFTWGSEALGLYLRVAAQADLGISFKPFLLLGRMAVRGELHLFIVSIEASASAEVIITGPGDAFISAKVCGSVDFFFFEVSGCVTLEIGERPDSLPEPELLVRALSLHSRTPAVVLGAATDRPVDGSLGEASERVGDGPWDGTEPVVPVDAIPVLQLELRPHVTGGCTFLGTQIPTKLAPDAWLRRGETFLRYSLTSVGLAADGHAEPLLGGDRPVVWWDRYGKPGGGDDNDVQLALLSWVPDPTPAAAERTIEYDERITQRWGDICREVAPPTRVLWTFERSLVGPSSTGWTLTGVPWPDPPGRRRSSPPPLGLTLTEPWRTGNSVADAITEVTPAVVFGSDLLPGRILVAPSAADRPVPAIADDADFEALFTRMHPHQVDDRLFDALRFGGGVLQSFSILVAAQREPWEDGLFLIRGVDDGRVVLEVEPTSDPAVRVTDIAQISDLPAEWWTLDSVWREPVDKMMSAWEALWRHVENVGLYLVEIDEVLAEAPQIELGMRDVHRAGWRPPWFTNWAVLAVEGLTAAERRRFGFDENDRDLEISTVDGALGADQSQRALLRPGTGYTVEVTYDVTTAQADSSGNPDATHARTRTGLRQGFRFRTDDAVPERLDPWVLATDPFDHEPAFFYGDRIRLVLATHATRSLVKAYGRDLVAIVRAASGQHPPAGDGLDPSRTLLTEAALATAPVLLPAFVVPPFAAALGELAPGLPCVDLVDEADRHELLTLTMQLEPCTEYVLDLETEPGTGSGTRPMFRRHFTTSRYPGFAALAAAVRGAPVGVRRVADAAPILDLAAETSTLTLTDLDFEGRIRRLRWGDLACPDGSRVTVIRRDGAGADPSVAVAVLLESRESLWRSRPAPEYVTDAHGVRRFEIRPQRWLEVTPAPGGLVRRLVHSSSGERTLVLLDAGAAPAGGSVRLTLQRRRHALFEGGTGIDGASLLEIEIPSRAPWEQ